MYFTIPPSPAGSVGSGRPSPDDAQPEVRRLRGLGQAEALEPDAGPAWAVEEPGAVAEQDRQDGHRDLVERPRLEALAGGAGPENVDVLVAGRGPGRGEGRGQIRDERAAPDPGGPG